MFHGSSTGLPAGPIAAETSADTILNTGDSPDDFGWSVSTAGDVNGDGYTDVIVGMPNSMNGDAHVYLGSDGGLSESSVWSKSGSGGEFGYSVSTAGDVNGDGYADVLVGERYYSDGKGRMYLYLGSPSGINLLKTGEGYDYGDELGISVSTAGDVNGDGYSDIIIGANRYTNGQSDEGAAYVIYGSPSGLASSPDWVVSGSQSGEELGVSVSYAGDVNGDGFSDVIVGAQYYDGGQSNEGRALVFHGSSTGPSTTADWEVDSDFGDAWFGYSVSTAGDVNGDGYSDVIVGAYHYANPDSYEGAAFVYHGSASGLSTTPDWQVEGNQVNAYYGISVSTAGDVNGDGFSDIIVGAQGYTNGESSEGMAFVYHGSASGLLTTPDWTAESNQADAYFGSSVSTAGDVDGDGFSDVIIGAIAYGTDGRAFVYHGSSGGLSTIADWTKDGEGSVSIYDRFGYSVSTAGDVNGDGFSDVIVGAPLYSNSAGRAYVFHGSGTGLSTSVNWTLDGYQMNTLMGLSVSTAGDVNGDGYSDVIVGAPGLDTEGTDAGEAYVFHGSASGLSGAPNAVAGDADWSDGDYQGGAGYGNSVSTAGDVNGDGYSDIIVGSKDYVVTTLDEGRAYLYYGNNGDGLDRKPRQFQTDGATRIDHLGVSDSINSFKASALGRSPMGRSSVALELEVKSLGTAFDGTGTTTSTMQDSGLTGYEFIEDATGLSSYTPYHWRARIRYSIGDPMGQAAGPWFSPFPNGWEEADLRTDYYTLTIDITPVGGGEVVSSDGGIDCPGDCAENYASGANVTLTAQNPAVGYEFNQWSGDLTGS
ncbi:MAG: VCBS repeat-containing protein, partial [Deltaproteobacteria bacterium]|nr:VCBS repeat-containing protein [Deltaproteobacteria bacterium]